MIFLQSVLFCLLFSSTLTAHQTGLSYVEIKEKSDHNIEIRYKKPLEDTQTDMIRLQFPAHCTQTTEESISIVNGYILTQFSLWCTERGLKNSRIWVEGLVSSDRGILLRYESSISVEQLLLRSHTPFALIGQKSTKLNVFRDYLNLGVTHILVGYDHLLFIFALILLVSSFKILLFSVTAFTLAHSLSLALAIFDLISVPSLYVEAMIALSILFLAKELMSQNQNSLTKKYLPAISFIFGLLHGLGFSNVLSSIGLPKDELPLALFSFNVGIEMGQLIFIVLISILFFIFKRYTKTFHNSLKIFGAYAIGTLAAFWFIERVIAFTL